MKKRAAALILAAMLCATAFAGCNDNSGSGNSSGGGATGENVKITIKQYKAEIDTELGNVIEQYKKVAPNVEITFTSIGAGSDIGQVLKADMQAGSMPTIFNAIGPAEYDVYKDYLEDLSDQPWVSHANKGALDLMTVDGKIYGLPVATEGLGLIVNKAIFDEAGVDISSLKTQADIDAAFAKVDAKIKDGSLKEKFPNLEAVTGFQGAETWVLGDHAENIALINEFNGDPFKAYDSKTVEFKYGDAYKAYTDMMIKYSKFADNGQGAVAYTYSKDAVPDLANGKIACIQQGNWAYGEIAKIDENTAKNLTLMPMPIGGENQENAIVTLIPQYWVVNSQASDAEKKAAKDFLNWLYQSEEGMDIVVNTFGFIPVFDNFGDRSPSDPLSKDIVKASADGKIVSAVFKGTPDGWGQNSFGAAVQGYVAGTQTWDQVLETAKTAWADAKK